MKKKRNKDTKTIKTILVGLLIFAFSFYVSSNYYQLVLIRGDSMEPSYHNLQLVIMDKTRSSYETGDVVVIKKEGIDNLIIKRIVACCGDTIEINNKKLYVNDKALTRYADLSFDFSGLLGRETTLHDDEFIVIGDNISVSRDSRHEEIGIIKEEEIIGTIVNSNLGD